MSKVEKIEVEKKRLLELVGLQGAKKEKNAPKKKRALLALVDNAAFMAVSLKELQEAINRKGYVEEYQNGKEQKGVKKSSETDIYNSMVKNYIAAIKQICDAISDEIEADALDAFLRERP